MTRQRIMNKIAGKGETIFAGGQILRGQIYNNCIRTEKGYCGIQWKESSTTSPDPFDVGTGTSIDATACADFIFIPNLSPNGINEIAVPVGTLAFQSEQCGSNFGIQGMGTIASALTSEYCFSLEKTLVMKAFWDAQSVYIPWFFFSKHCTTTQLLSLLINLI